MSNRRRKTPTTWYVLFEWPGDDFGNLAPVLSRLFHCACFLKSPPLTVLWEEWRAIFSIPRRSTSSPVRGAERVLSWTILSGSWNGTQPVGKENVLWCLMVRPRFSLPMDSIMSVLFGGKFSLVAAEQNNDKAHETRPLTARHRYYIVPICAYNEQRYLSFSMSHCHFDWNCQNSVTTFSLKW